MFNEQQEVPQVLDTPHITKALSRLCGNIFELDSFKNVTEEERLLLVLFMKPETRQSNEC